MKKNGRRVLGLLLLLIMMFTLVPSPNIFALGEEEESVAAESEVTPEEQMVEIANDILSDIDAEEDKEETEPDSEPVTEAELAEDVPSVTEDEVSEEEMLEVDPAENEDSEDMLPETDLEGNPENGPEGETVSEEVEPDDEEEEEYNLPPFEAEAGNIEIKAITTNKAFDVPVNLVASVIPQEDDSYKEAEDALDNSGKQYDGMLALDIHFEDENQMGKSFCNFFSCSTQKGTGLGGEGPGVGGEDRVGSPCVNQEILRFICHIRLYPWLQPREGYL